MSGLGEWASDHFNLLMAIVMGLLFTLFMGFVVWEVQPIDGTVERKQFVAAHNEIYFTQSCTTTHSGKNTHTNCISTPHNRWVNDKWSINVCDEKRCKWVEVSQVRYDDVRVGNHFSEK